MPVTAQGQVSTLKKMLEAQAPKKSEPAETKEDSLKRIKTRLKEVGETLERLKADTLPDGIDAEELDERRSDLEQAKLTMTRALKTLVFIDEARKDLEKSRAEEAAWMGFKEKSPYSLLMIDNLLNERDAVQSKLNTYESSLTNYERIHASTLEDAKATEQALSSALGAVQKAGEGAGKAAAVWRHDAVIDKSRMLAARAGSLKASCEVINARIAAAKIELVLLDRKLKVAKPKSRFNDEDMALIRKESDERKVTLNVEIRKASTLRDAAITARIKEQAALEKLTIPDAAASEETPALKLAKHKLEVAEGRVEARQTIVEALESLPKLEDICVKAYQDRRLLIEATKPEQRAKALKALGVPRENLWGWENVIDNEIARASVELIKLEAHAAANESNDPIDNLFNEQRANISGKLAALQRVLKAVTAQRKLVKRWILEYAPDPAKAGWRERLSTLGTTGWRAVKNIWSFEVMSYEDKVVVDGQTITGEIPVTLGQLLKALIFFIVGYWIALRIARRLQAGLVTRGHIADAQARTLRNWGMIVFGFFLVMGTLAFLKIPLTMFAYLGGALAIGLGFGTQTLIKNFICGIIVLAERKVRVGDIVDVEGITGTVIEINTRSSVVRSPDEVETMIPNSVFLENRVSNWTLSNTKMRRSLRVGVAYGSPPPEVMKILTEAAGRHGLVCKEPAPFVVLDDFGDSALIFSLYFWLDLRGSTNAMIVTSDLRLMIEKRFAETGIIVPYPQRDVHLASDKPLQVQWVGKPEAP